MSSPCLGLITAHTLRSARFCDVLCLQSLVRDLSLQLLGAPVSLSAIILPLRRRLPAALLQQIEQCILDEPDGGWTLSRLAKLANLSPCHFARLFKDSTGQTVHSYVLERRLRHSYALLLGTELSISHVAVETGFADESHFGRRFKALFGVTPGIVRRGILH